MIDSNKKQIKTEILKRLLEDKGAEISGGYMSQSMGISRAAIAKHIKALRLQGFDIRAKPGGGYTLDNAPNILHESLIRIYSAHDLPVVVLNEVKSTNIDAKAWAEDNAQHGALIVAKAQSDGRGRKARHWQSVKGGIWSSIILRPRVEPRNIQPVTIAAAVAVSQAISMHCSTCTPLIKWPNDILINGKKVCGVLTEFIGDMDEIRYLVVGIGINHNFEVTDLDDDLLFKATTLSDENININASLLIAEVRNLLLSLIETWQKEQSVKGIMDEYRKAMAYKNEEVIISGAGQTITGQLLDIDDEGALVIQTSDGKRKIISGEISLRSISHEI